MVKKGLVLGGGGSRGAYEIGVWKATRELGIEFSVVTGTSIGALNGALVVQGDFEKALVMWEGMQYESVMANVSSADLETLEGARAVLRTALGEMVADGGMDITPLETLVRDMLDEEAVRRSPIQFGIVTVEFPSLRAREMEKADIPVGEMCDYLLASCACYPAFKPKSIDGNRFVDGGYKDNLPINLAVDLGAQEVLAVDLKSVGLIPKKYNDSVPVRILRPYWDLGIFLTFDTQRIRRNIQLGYLDTLKSYGRYEGLAYAFPLGETQQNFEALATPAAALLTQMGFANLEKSLSPVDRFLHRRLVGTLQRPGRRKVSYPDLLLRAGELAGELLGLPPDMPYTAPDFNAALLHAFREAKDVSVQDLEDIFKGLSKDTKAVTGMAKEFGKMETEEVLNLLYRWIVDFFAGESRSLTLVAAAMPKEFAAAFYLYLLKHREEPAPPSPKAE